ncbi:MAG: EAL domain-containing protein [Nannocystaceae bacterium]|nr:EAL domain-containing protein [Nannocystaceae bacterium]
MEASVRKAGRDSPDESVPRFGLEPRPSLGDVPPLTAVLVVDDDPADGFLIRSKLRSSDPSLRVDVVETFDEALGRLCSGDFQAATVDHQLGVANGLELIENARDRGVSIPLILLTGSEDTHVESEAILRGASDFLGKGETTGRLLERTIRFNMQRCAASALLTESKRRYEAVVAGSQDGIWDWDLRTGGLYLSERLKNSVGIPLSQRVHSFKDLLARVHPSDRAGLVGAVRAHVSGETETLSFEYRLAETNGLSRWFSLRGLVRRDATGEIAQLAGSQTDITERKQQEEDARHQSLHDPLTGLANRSLLNDRIEHALRRMRRESEYGFSLMYLDLDGFKAINDTHGHAAGDLVLVEVAARLRDQVRAVDCVARVGGDEFVVLLDRCVYEVDAVRVAEAIQARVEASLEAGPEPLHVGVSIGLRVVTDTDASPTELLSAADRAMYSRKADRKRQGSLHVVERGGQGEVSLEARLRRALNETLVIPHFQPIVAADCLEVVGFEALARWHDEELGQISPAQFIPAAHRSGVIIELERQMLLGACTWAASMGGDNFVSVNISAAHVRSQHFAAHVRDALSKSGLNDPRRLQLELTEQTPWDQDLQIDEALCSLQNDGVQLVLDDFGTGYSTAEVLARFPVSTVKLSRSLVAGIQANARRRCIYTRLVELALSLGTTVTAEGVENAEELALVREAGATHIQGFMFGHPAALPLSLGEAA